MKALSQFSIHPGNLLLLTVITVVVGIIALLPLPVPVAVGVAAAVSMLLISPSSVERPKLSFKVNVQALLRAAIAGLGSTFGLYIVHMLFAL